MTSWSCRSLLFYCAFDWSSCRFLTSIFWKAHILIKTSCGYEARYILLWANHAEGCFGTFSQAVLPFPVACYKGDLHDVARSLAKDISKCFVSATRTMFGRRWALCLLLFGVTVTYERILPFYMNLVDIVSCNVPMHTVKFLLYRMSELSKNTSRVCPIQKHNFWTLT